MYKSKRIAEMEKDMSVYIKQNMEKGNVEYGTKDKVYKM